jgi:hypothetical protein
MRITGWDNKSCRTDINNDVACPTAPAAATEIALATLGKNEGKHLLYPFPKGSECSWKKKKKSTEYSSQEKESKTELERDIREK